MPRSTWFEWGTGDRRASRTAITRSVVAGALVLGSLGWLAGPASAQQDGTVAGTVVAERTTQPIPDAQVTVAGSPNGATTDAAGRFRLIGLSGDSVQLTVRRIGFRPATVGARVGDMNVRVTLLERAVELNSVVVTGTAGATSQRQVGNAVSQIAAADVVATQPVMNVQELLNARAPGVNIIQSSGQVGAGARIRIRGASSLSLVNEPLIYVDGVRVDNTQASGPTSQGFGSRPISRWNDFNPEDIESVEVIKGPAAATLYGTEASNGVIQIITKKGTSGKPRVEVSARQGANWFQDPNGRIFTNWGTTQVGGTDDEPVLDTVPIDIVALEKSRGRNIFRTGQIQEYNGSVSGGSPLFRYYVGGGVTTDEGVERNNELHRSTGRANLSLTPSTKWEANANVGYTSGRTNIGFESGGGGTTWTTYFATPSTLGTPQRGFYSGPPEAYYQGFDIFQDADRFTGSLTLTHRPLPWFNHRLIGGIDHLNEDNQEIGPINNQLGEFFSELSGCADCTGGYMDVSTRDVRYNTLDYAANAVFSLTRAITSTTSAGSQYYEKVTRRRAQYGEGFPAPGFKSLQSLARLDPPEDDIIPNKTLGFFGQEQIGLNNRIFLTAALRADDNSAFGSNFDRAYYPKFSGSWVLSEEPFFTVPFVSQLKLRAAYGQSGQQPDAFAAIGTYRAGGSGTVTPYAFGNPSLGPERSYETELGFDAGLLDDRLGVEFTYFTGVTKDAILSRQVAPSSGFGGEPTTSFPDLGIQYFNAGRVERHGIELLLRGEPVRRNNVGLDLSFNIGTNTNKIESLGETDFVPAGALTAHKVGYSVGSWFSKRVVSAQYFAEGDSVSNVLCDNGAGGTVGCDDAPAVYLGNTTPKTEGAFSATLTLFKNIRLNTLVDFKSGYKKMNGINRVRCHLFDECRVNYFPQEFDPVYVAQVRGGSGFVNDLIQDASFTRLREVAATFTLPDRWARYVNGSRASLTFAGRNLHLWTNWPGLDPEASFNSGTRGGFGQWEQNVVPQVATFVTTLNVGF